MPIYEYTCDDCGRLTSVFTRTMSAKVDATCSHCGSAKLSRVLSRFAYNQTEQQVLERHGADGVGGVAKRGAAERQRAFAGGVLRDEDRVRAFHDRL